MTEPRILLVTGADPVTLRETVEILRGRNIWISLNGMSTPENPLPWNGGAEDLLTRLRAMIDRAPAGTQVMADAGHYLLPYCDLVLSEFRSSRVICVGRRDEIWDVVHDVVEPMNAVNPWQNHNGRGDYRWSWLDCQYPKIYGEWSREKAALAYVREFYSEVSRLANTYVQVDSRLMLRAGEGSGETHQQLRNFLGIP